jgi:peroxiredoxin
MLEHFQAQLQRHDATVLGVTFEDTTTDSLSFVHRFKLTYPNVRDVSGNFAHAYGTAQLPESFVVDRLGRIETIWRGEITKGFLERALAVAERS